MHFVSWRKRALPSLPTPMMSSKTTFPHRIGGSLHKFPENSQPISPPPSPPPPPHPSTGQPLTSCLKNRHFYNFFHPPISANHRDRCQAFWAVAFLVLGAGKKQSGRDHGNGEEEDPNPAATSWWGGGAWAGDTKGAGQWAGTARKSERILEFVHRFLSFGKKKSPFIARDLGIIKVLSAFGIWCNSLKRPLRTQLRNSVVFIFFRVFTVDPKSGEISRPHRRGTP